MSCGMVTRIYIGTYNTIRTVRTSEGAGRGINVQDTSKSTGFQATLDERLAYTDGRPRR